MKIKIITVGLLMLLGALILASIPAAASSAHDGADNLVGSQWQLVAYGALGAETPVVEGSTVTLIFGSDGSAGGSGGCNVYGGGYSIDNGALRFEQLVSTLMACVDQAVMDQEAAYFRALESATGYELVDDQLIIFYGDSQRLVFARLDSLVGSSWQLVAYGAAGEETRVVEGSVVTLEFREDNSAGGRGGCNGYGGTFAVDGDSIRFSQLVSTLMACVDQAVMDQEAAYFRALESAARYEVFEDQLVITYGEDQRLIFTRLPTLKGTQWQLVAYGAAEDASPVVEGSVVTLEFGEDDRAVGSGGCNNYNTSYSVEGHSLTFGAVSSTRRLCSPENVMEQESAYFAALEAATGYTLSGDQLVITYGDGQQLVFIERAFRGRAIG